MSERGGILRRTKEEAIETRTRILEAALKFFSERQYAKVSVAEIAASVGMTKGAVYWHFKSKNRLFISLAEYLHEEAARNFTLGEKKPESLNDLKNYYKAFVKSSEGEDLHAKIRKILLHMNEWPDEVCVALRDLKRESLVREKDFVTKVLEKEKAAGKINACCDCEAAAEAVVAVFSGLGNLRFMDMLEKDFFRHVDFIFSAVEHELAAGCAPAEHK